MNRIKKISTGFLLRITAVMAAIIFCAALPGQTALTGHAANTLGAREVRAAAVMREMEMQGELTERK